MVRVQIAEWSPPTRAQRFVILAMSHLLTLLGLVAWTLGAPTPATTEPAPVALSRKAPLFTVGSGYVVRGSDWQAPIPAVGVAMPPASLTLATPAPAPSR
jgi:hypothetical protein